VTGDSKIGRLRAVLAELLEEHRAAGALPTSARFLFYELVACGVLSKDRTGARRPDQMLHDALTDLREDERVPWAWIADETRALEDWVGSPTVAAGLASSLTVTGSTRGPGIPDDPHRVALAGRRPAGASARLRGAGRLDQRPVRRVPAY
jgi:hypothetical protein